MNSGTRAEYQGYEVLLWPLEFINITATPESINHTVPQTTNSGLWDNGHRNNVQVQPLYAPCSMRLVRQYINTYQEGHTQVWQSINKVWIPQFNEPQYVTMAFSHSDTLYYTNIGTEIVQGTHFYDTGVYGIGSGAHVHMLLYIGQIVNLPVGYNSYVRGNIYYSPNAPDNIATFFYTLASDERIRTQDLPFIDYEGAIHTTGLYSLLYYLMIRKNKKKKEVLYDTN